MVDCGHDRRHAYQQEAEESSTHEGILDAGISLQKWLSSDATGSIDLYTPLMVYSVYRHSPGDTTPQSEDTWSAAFAPSGRLMLHLYW